MDKLFNKYKTKLIQLAAQRYKIKNGQAEYHL